MAKNITSVAEAQRITEKRLPETIYSALKSGMEQGKTRDNNVLAFDEIGVIPRIADLGSVHDQTTKVMGIDISFPITSYVSAQGICSEGEITIARADKKAGTIIARSYFATKSVEEVHHTITTSFFNCPGLHQKKTLPQE